MIPKFRAWDEQLEQMYLLSTINFDNNEITYGTEYDEYEVSLDDDSVILMQSTGLTDKNGKDIFEGDILKSPYGFIGKVNIVEGAWYVQHSDFTNNHFLYVAQGKSVIIGNIHEHSHLLDNGGNL